MTRTERQKICVDNWRTNKGIGSMECCTGFGKTRIATNVMKQMYTKNSDTTFVIIVPTIPLKNQWEQILGGIGLLNNSRVFVINSAILIPEVVSCDLLILDEIHKYAAGTFFSVFDIFAYKFILGLTATLERMDGKHELLKKHSPIIEKVTLFEARRNGWIADYIEYNLSIEMNEADKQEYVAINTWLGKAFAIFNNDYYIALDCCSPKNRFFNGKMHYGGEHFVNTYMIKYGEALVLYDSEERQLFGQALINEVVKQANNTTRLIREREVFLIDNDSKIEVARDIIETLKMKTVTFGKSTACADKLTTMLGDRAASYHSYLETQIRDVPKVKTYKSFKAAEKFAFSENTTPLKEGELWSVHYTKKTKVGKDRIKKEVIAKLESDEISIINSAKALDMGLDVTGMQLAIIIAGDSNPTTQTQRIGRVIRKESEKVAIIVNLLLKNTQDERWCKRRQSKNSGLVRHIDKIEDIMI